MEPLPAAIELPAAPACVLEGPWASTKPMTELLLRPGGPAFATARGGAAKLHFPRGARAETQGLELEADGIAVRGHVDADAADLRAARPFWLSRLALPTIFTRLRWTEAADGALTLTTETPRALEVLEPPLLAKRPCADVGIGGGTFDPGQAIGGGARPTPKELVKGRPIDIALEPGGKPVARARPEKGEAHVDVLEVRGNSSRISWYLDTLYVVGWVSSRDLEKPGAGVGYGSGSGRLGGLEIKERGAKITCPADVLLVVDAGGEQATAGVIRARTTIEKHGSWGRSALTRVVVRSKQIRLAEGASWLARSSELQACSPAQ